MYIVEEKESFNNPVRYKKSMTSLRIMIRTVIGSLTNFKPQNKDQIEKNW